MSGAPAAPTVAAVPRPQASALYGEPTHWTRHNPNWSTIWQNSFRPGSGRTRAQCMSDLLGMVNDMPIALAFTIEGDPEHIYVGHSPTQYPAEPGTATVFDGGLVVLVGNDIDMATPVVLPDTSFQAINNVTAYNRNYMTGANGHTHPTAPVQRWDHTASGTGDTNDLNIRKVFVFTPNTASTFLAGSTDGTYELMDFYNRFIRDVYASGTQAEKDAMDPLCEWWRASCMRANAAPNHLRSAVGLLSTGLPLQTARLESCAARVKRSQSARLGIGGPGITAAGFASGIQALQDTMTANHEAGLRHQRDAANKTFTDKYGSYTAQRVYNMCNATDDNSLPSLHKLLLKCDKAQAFAVVTAHIATEVDNSVVPLTSANLPLATPALVNNVFKGLAPCGDGLTFGQGLTPFAIVCRGHPEAHATNAIISKATLASEGNTLSMADAETMITTDVRFPSRVQVAVEKLYGFSILVDLFHGRGTAIATNVRSFVCTVCPSLHNLHQISGQDLPALDLVNRVLFEVQQDYFAWLSAVVGKSTPADRPPAPKFEAIQNAVLTYRASSLSPLPSAWYSMIERPSSKKEHGPRAASGSVSHFNQHVDEGLKGRYATSGFSSITAMTSGKDAPVPKHAGSPVCLSWALKGQCNTNCKRADQHVRYSAATIKALNSFLTKCGVDPTNE